MHTYIRTSMHAYIHTYYTHLYIATLKLFIYIHLFICRDIGAVQIFRAYRFIFRTHSICWQAEGGVAILGDDWNQHTTDFMEWDIMRSLKVLLPQPQLPVHQQDGWFSWLYLHSAGDGYPLCFYPLRCVSLSLPQNQRHYKASRCECRYDMGNTKMYYSITFVAESICRNVECSNLHCTIC